MNPYHTNTVLAKLINFHNIQIPCILAAIGNHTFYIFH